MAGRNLCRATSLPDVSATLNTGASAPLSRGSSRDGCTGSMEPLTTHLEDKPFSHNEYRSSEEDGIALLAQNSPVGTDDEDIRCTSGGHTATLYTGLLDYESDGDVRVSEASLVEKHPTANPCGKETQLSRQSQTAMETDPPPGEVVGDNAGSQHRQPELAQCTTNARQPDWPHTRTH
jgi:hypothetical protein